MGRTHHRRFAPFDRAFSYDIAMISLDVDRLDEADLASRWFSIDRPNLISFNRHKQRLATGSDGLRRWAADQLRGAGIATAISSLHFLTFPSVLGSGFAPISVWIARDSEGGLLGVIYEVHNTFGEAHAYVFPSNDALPAHEAAKEFHVSPFFDVSGTYRFRLTMSDEIFALVVDNIEDGECVHSARLSLRARELTDGAIAQWLIRMPFSGFGVIVAIHWQALQLWLGGARYNKKPAQRDRRTTRAAASDSVATARHETRRSA